MIVLGNEQFFTVKEIAKRFQVTPRTVYDWMDTKKIGFLKVVGRVLIPQSDIDAFMAKILESKKNAVL
jgi:excisionase family DNA binding protein